MLLIAVVRLMVAGHQTKYASVLANTCSIDSRLPVRDPVLRNPYSVHPYCCAKRAKSSKAIPPLGTGS